MSAGEKLAVRAGKHRIEVSRPDKILYPARKFTKAAVVDYYLKIAPQILPHLRNRPITLKRFPDGVFGEAFYEKDAPAFAPEWIKTFPVPRRDPTQPPIQYILINDAATLAWAAGAAALELHPFLHRVPHIETPTHIVFDLDPGEGANIIQCAEVAFLLQETLGKLRLKCFPKVSGSKGLQIYIPLNTPITYGATQPFARAIAELLARSHPDRIVADMSKTLRRGKVFIDWSQNADHKTTVAVYSLRAKSQRPYVSLPVTWSELNTALKSNSPDSLYWEAPEALQRVKKLGDIFAPVLKLKQKLPPEFTTGRARRSARAGEGNSHTLEPTTHARTKNTPTPKSLGEYTAKRHFDKTSEPTGSETNITTATIRRSAQGSRRRFVVQKHAASHLHYDFRLEIHDVLKSWAVPKSIPLHENETAAAFATEDHPLDYLQFEGTIPKGQYGGGTVMVWDIGTYEILEGNYWKGRLVVFLNGKKLRGEWTLERQREEDGKAKWLLTKTNGNAKPIAANRHDISALTARTMDRITAENTAVWQSDRSLNPVTEPRSKRLHTSIENKSAADGEGERPREPLQLHAAKFSKSRQHAKVPPAPKFIAPMKATLARTLPSGPDWLYEVKWDGYRALALKHGDTVRLLSLKNKPLNTDFPAVVDSVRQIAAHTALIDGEVVAVNNSGKPSFQILQNRKSLGRDWHIVYYAFDLLNLEGDDLTRRPLVERKEKLRTILGDSGVRYSAELTGPPEIIEKTIREAGLEGIVAKKRNSTYRGGSRVESWLKIKYDQSQEFVIGGYNPEAKSFQSVLLGYYEGDKLIFAGKVRQGFNPASRAALYKQMQPLLSTACPFSNLPSSKKGHFGEGVTAEDMPKLRWLKPKLVAQVAFTEWTNYGLLRHATFLGLREDKSAKEVIREDTQIPE
jgi:bifunctional non-homologous end joining protein LigD